MEQANCYITSFITYYFKNVSFGVILLWDQHFRDRCLCIRTGWRREEPVYFMDGPATKGQSWLEAEGRRDDCKILADAEELQRQHPSINAAESPRIKEQT